jgi:hypothetical protein
VGAAQEGVGEGEEEEGEQEGARLLAPLAHALIAPLEAPLRAVLAAWQLLGEQAFCEGPAAVGALKLAAKEAKVPPGRAMLALRWALTGLDAGAALADTVHLLGLRECNARVLAVLDIAAGHAKGRG